ncbi:endothelin-converting enzyme 2-like [Ornithodoros turicata]|uniref:endothelin-converting enzyme 2-like n=1 Tax=Ornithodoros turicata TaxID=34597 RepID=UPI0031390F80
MPPRMRPPVRCSWASRGIQPATSECHPNTCRRLFCTRNWTISFPLSACRTDTRKAIKGRPWIMPPETTKQQRKQKHVLSLSSYGLHETLSSYKHLDAVPTVWQKWKTAAQCVAAFAMTAVMVGALLFWHQRPYREKDYLVCRTQPCMLYAAILNGSINRNRNPCDDFYSYVCDGWDRKHNDPIYWGHVVDFSFRLIEVLESKDIPIRSQSAVEKAAKFYQSCKRANGGGPGEIVAFRYLWRKCEVDWPRATRNADVFKTVILLRRTFQEESIINFDVRQFQDGPRLYVFSGDDLAVFYNVSVLIKAANGYQDYFESIQNILKTPGTFQGDLQPYGRFLEIESDIQNDLHVKLDKTATPITVNFSGLLNLTPHVPVVRWLHAFALLDIPRSTPIDVANVAYLRALDDLFLRVGETELHRYVGWLNVQQMAPFINRELVEAVSDIPSRATDIAIASCLYRTEAFMGWATYAKLAAQIFTSTTRQELHSLIKNIGDTAVDKIMFSWLPLKKALMRYTFKAWRSDLMKYPDRFPNPESLDPIFVNVTDMGDHLMENWVNLVRGRARTDATKLKLNSPHFVPVSLRNVDYEFYVQEDGRVRLPPYAATVPLYEYEVSEPVKYGGLGFLLAHYAFDILKYHNPSLANNSPSCLDLAGSPYKDETILRSAVSLDIARDAFSRRSSTDIRLPFLRTLTGKQIFYVATCFLMCGQQDRSFYVRRCNEPLKHNAAFAKAFSCRRGSPMRSRRKCDFFTT